METNFKTTWDFLDCTHEDAMYLSWSKYNNTGNTVGGNNLTLEEELHWHLLEIERLKSSLVGSRSVNTQLGIQWATKNAQSMKSSEVKTLVAQKKFHSEKAKHIKSFLKNMKDAAKKFA